MRIYNSLTGTKEDFAPINPPHVSMYVCGVTPYDMSHLGHARTYVTFDVVQKYLRARGYDVKYVRNFTDVEDKIIKKGNAEGVAALSVSERFIAEYYRDMDSLGVAKADAEPKVSESIPEIIELIERLVKRGHAYAMDGSVYFQVDTDKDYLKLSGRSAEDQIGRAHV